jgi:hypothetical protein
MKIKMYEMIVDDGQQVLKVARAGKDINEIDEEDIERY